MRFEDITVSFCFITLKKYLPVDFHNLNERKEEEKKLLESNGKY